MKSEVAPPDISTDVLIVGAGPAGVVTAAAALSAGFHTTVLEQAANVGGWSLRASESFATGPLQALTLFNAGVQEKLPQNASAEDARAYLTTFAAHHGLEKCVRLGCRLTNLRFQVEGDSKQHRWYAAYEDLDLRRRGSAVARHVVLCTGHVLPNSMTGAEAAALGLDQVPPHVRMLHCRAASPSDLVGGGVVVVGDGLAALDCASAVALLAGGRAVTLVAQAMDGSPAPVRSGSLLLDAARRRAFQAALQPHPSAPSPSAVGRALIAPTKRRFWAYVKGRAAAAVSPSSRSSSGGGGGGSGSVDRSPGAGTPKAVNSGTLVFSANTVEVAADAGTALNAGAVNASPPPMAAAVCTAGDSGTSACIAVTPELLMRSRVVLWAPSFRDPRVMPFLDATVKVALLQGEQQPPRPLSQQQQPPTALSGREGCSDQLTLYRGVLHPGLPGLAFVGYEAHAGTSLLVLELQAQWLVAALTARLPLPSPAAMRADMARQRAWRAAALASPLMSTHGSLARAHEDHYVRQLLADLAGLVELRRRPQPPLPQSLQPGSQQQQSRSDETAGAGLCSDRVLVPLWSTRRPTDAAGLYAGTADAAGARPQSRLRHQMSCGVVQGSDGETLEPSLTGCSPASSGKQRAGMWVRTQTVSEPSRSPVSPGTPRSLCGVSGVGPEGDSAGGVTGYVASGSGAGVAAKLFVGNAEARPSSPLVSSSSATAGATAAAPGMAAPPGRRHTPGSQLFRSGISDAGGCSGGGGSVDGTTPEGGDGDRSSCGTASAVRDSAGNKASTRGTLTTSQMASGLFAEVLESPVFWASKAVLTTTTMRPSEDIEPAAAAGAAPPNCRAPAATADATVIVSDGPGVSGHVTAMPPSVEHYSSSTAAGHPGDGAANPTSSVRRHSAASLPLLKLLPLPRFGQGSSGGVGGGSGDGTPRGPPPASVQVEPGTELSQRPSALPASQRRGAMTKRSAPRRSMSFSNISCALQDHAKVLQDNARGRTASGAPVAAAPAFAAGAPDSLEFQLAALRSHLLDPKAVPFPRASLSPVGAAAAAPSASAPLATVVTVPGPSAVTLLVTRGSTAEGEEEGLGEARGSAGEVAGLGQRLTTIEERHFLESGSGSFDEIARDALTVCEERAALRGGGSAVCGDAAVATATASGTFAAFPSPATAAVVAAVAARRQAPPRRSQTTSCLGAPAAATATVMARFDAAEPLAQGSPSLRGELPTPPIEAAASPRLRPLFRLSVGAAAVATEALLSRIPSPWGGGCSGGTTAAGLAPADGLKSVPLNGPTMPASGPMTGTTISEQPSSKAKAVLAADKRSPVGAIAMRSRRPSGGGSSGGGGSQRGVAGLRAGAGAGALSKSLGGLLGEAAEAARLPYSERIGEAAPPVRVQRDPFLRPRRAMALDLAAAAAPSQPAQLASPLLRSPNSLACVVADAAAASASSLGAGGVPPWPQDDVSAVASAATASPPMPALASSQQDSRGQQQPQQRQQEEEQEAAEEADDGEEQGDGLFNMDLVALVPELGTRPDAVTPSLQCSGAAAPPHRSIPPVGRQLPVGARTEIQAMGERCDERAGAGSAFGSGSGCADNHRGPAWVVRRATQARQEHIVGEVSSWLREALARKAADGLSGRGGESTNTATRGTPNMAALFSSQEPAHALLQGSPAYEGSQYGRDPEVGGTGRKSMSFSGVEAPGRGWFLGRQLQSGSGAGGASSPLRVASGTGDSEADGSGRARPGGGGATTTGIPRRRPPCRSQTESCLGKPPRGPVTAAGASRLGSPPLAS